MKFWCRHRWSTLKRWQVGNQYFVLQRCRRCERWVRKQLELINGKLEIKTETYTELNDDFKRPQMIQPLEPVDAEDGKKSSALPTIRQNLSSPSNSKQP